MRYRNIVLGSTAMLAALGASLETRAATISPGGALDLTVTGFARFLAHGGDLDNARLDPSVSSGLDFSNDTEVHVVARARHDATGMEYGGTIEFEADTDSTFNTDETWLFIRGGFGEFRFGDEDGAVDNSKVGGYTIAAGTGGIDGSVVDTIGTKVIAQFDSGDSTKIRYYTPSFGGFTLGVSYTPNVDSNGQNLAPKDTELQQMVEGALVWEGSFGGLDITASGTGSICDSKLDDDDCHTWGAGAAIGLWGIKLAGSYWTEKLADTEKTGVTAGIGYGIGPANFSVTWAKLLDSDNLESDTGVPLDEPQNLVASADLGLMPGLVLGGDVGWFDNDASNTPAGLNDDGYQAVVRLDLAF